MTPETTALLRDAAEWRLIGLLFECPGAGWQEEVARLAAEVADEGLKSAAAAAAVEAGEAMYHTTLGPGGPVAPREVSHHAGLLPGPLLGALRVSYQAFSYAPALPEAPDHVAVEAGFIAYLRLKEAYARERGDAEQAAIAADAARRIVEDHLSTLAEPLATVLENSGITYLAQAAAALLKRVGPRRVRPLEPDLAAIGLADSPEATCPSACACPDPDEEIP
jgi:hypothetical protein